MTSLADFLREHGALIISALALWAAWRANSVAQLAYDHAKKAALVDVQANLIREIDLQHAKLGTLLALTAEAALLYKYHPSLKEEDPRGHERVLKNIESIESLRTRYEEQRRLSEAAIGEGNIEKQHSILAQVRRLTVHVEEDIEKEKRNIDILKAQWEKAL